MSGDICQGWVLAELTPHLRPEKIITIIYGKQLMTALNEVKSFKAEKLKQAHNINN